MTNDQVTFAERKWINRLARGLMIVALVVGGATGSLAQENKDQPTGNEQAGAQDAKVKVERGAGGKKIYRITQGFVIEGRIQKPNAFYVLQRSQINYDWADLKQKFVRRILEAVSKSPF